MRIFGRLFASRAANSEQAAYRRLHESGFRPASIIDVGAYEGNWARLARQVFPDADILMIEPQASKAPMLKAMVGNGIRFEPALLSSEGGRSVTFYEMETGSSMMPENSNVPRRETHMTTATLDQIATGLPSPTFLKIDAQGAEIEILKGGPATIQGCGMIQLEVALLPYNAGAPEFLESVTFMKQLGFVPFDFSGFTRPNGRDLVQVDIIFAREESPLRRQTFVF